MNAESNQIPIDVLEQATAALRDAAPVDGPSPALVAATIAALESLETAPSVVVRPQQSKSRYRLLRYSGLAAAAAAVVLAAVLWFIDRTAALHVRPDRREYPQRKVGQFRHHDKAGEQAPHIWIRRPFGVRSEYGDPRRQSSLRVARRRHHFRYEGATAASNFTASIRLPRSARSTGPRSCPPMSCRIPSSDSAISRTRSRTTSSSSLTKRLMAANARSIKSRTG